MSSQPGDGQSRLDGHLASLIEARGLGTKDSAVDNHQATAGCLDFLCRPPGIYPMNRGAEGGLLVSRSGVLTTGGPAELGPDPGVFAQAHGVPWFRIRAGPGPGRLRPESASGPLSGSWGLLSTCVYF